MVSLTMDQFRLELGWLQQLQREVRYRRPARHPTYAVE
jgi:hypothetical protein